MINLPSCCKISEKKKPFRTKKYDEDDILNAISQQATAVRAKNTCPVHAAGLSS